jgi:phosphoribosylaminoimidazole-succinocarboxamide synthase
MRYYITLTGRRRRLMAVEAVVLRTEMPDIGVPKRGKVRDIYDLRDNLLLIATDRISAFDVVLPNGIPGKGKVLTQISVFWFGKMRDIIRNHVVATDVDDFPLELKKYREILDGRSMLVKKAKPLPVECIVRGYLSGSGWNEYREEGTVCGIALPRGLMESSRLDEPIFTPSTKAAEGHDINISFAAMEKIVGKDSAGRLRELSLKIYARARDIAEKKGIIIADTKFEFGLRNGELLLIDEILTPDSSRFWSAKNYQPGRGQDSYDKQIVRDYLLTLPWDKRPPGPALPDKIVQKTVERYREIKEILTGHEAGIRASS